MLRSVSFQETTPSVASVAAIRVTEATGLSSIELSLESLAVSEGFSVDSSEECSEELSPLESAPSEAV